MPDLIVSEDHGAVRLLTMNRHDKMNAFNGALSSALIEALGLASDDASVAAVVLTGGSRAFSAGADMKEATSHGERTQRQAIAAGAHGTALYDAVAGVNKPVIAAVNGYALGAGCAVAISADMVIAGEGAVFGYPEVKRGLAATAVTPTLVAQIGRKAASELLLLCENIPAARAEMLGLANRVVADDAVIARALEIAATMAAFDHDALWMTKRMIRRSADLPLDQAHHMVKDNMLVMRGFS
jgi:enoyl-CoA hydratase